MTDQAIPPKYLSDHLFLLVGTNPLPNLVAAKLLLKPQGQLYLVHSSATQPVAQRLARYWIEVERQQQPVYVIVDEADGADIRRQLQEVLRSIKDGQIGLNYTGGTKMMSVHACRVALIDDQGLRKRPFTLSYLNARTNTMYIEYGDEQPFTSKSLLYELKPQLQDIVKLHSFRLVTDIDTQVVLLSLANALIEAHVSKNAGKAWRGWCRDILRPQTRKENRNDLLSDKMLASISLPLPEDESLGDVVAEMRRVFALDAEARALHLGQSSQQAGLGKVGRLCRWLDGIWLEHYVFDCIDKIKDHCHIHDLGMGIRPQIESGSSEYDIDIGAMQGYQLYAISCTTDDEVGMCKLKLFEAFIRARNMAGDEAFVALVCMVDKPEKLEQQVIRSWDVAGKVRVFGRPQLANLTEHLAEWFMSTAAY